MKPFIRWPSVRTSSQLLPRRSYKPGRTLRIRPERWPNLVARPPYRFGVKPELTVVPP
jgi:hypothetical protein